MKSNKNISSWLNNFILTPIRVPTRVSKKSVKPIPSFQTNLNVCNTTRLKVLMHSNLDKKSTIKSGRTSEPKNNNQHSIKNRTVLKMVINTLHKPTLFKAAPPSSTNNFTHRKTNLMNKWNRKRTTRKTKRNSW